MSSLNYTFVGADPTSDNTGDYTPLIMPGTADIVNSQLERFDNNPNILEQFRSGVENATGADLQGYNVPVTPFSKIKNYHLSSLNASGMAGNQTMTFVNVLQEYMWTLSPQFARDRTNKYVDPPPGIILKEKYNLNTVIFSIDDFYKTLKERKAMSKKINPLFFNRMQIKSLLTPNLYFGILP